ncbi:MAG: IS1595 family transposase [Vulcanimicrobiaceae bacterium]
MPKPLAPPTTLIEAITYFADQDRAHEFVVKLRFPNGVACPRMGCGSTNVGYISTRRMWQCKDCKKQSSVKVGTIFEDSPIGFHKWLPAMWMIGGARNGISSCELARAIGVTQKTAWFMLHRIRLAMKHKSIAPPLSGEVEADETFVGGRYRSRFFSKSGHRKLEHGPATGKTTVFGMVERGSSEAGKRSRVRAMVVPDHKRSSLLPHIRQNVLPGSMLYTDALRSYRNLGPEYHHAFIDHMVTYVEGRVHTNTIENFWSCLKRTLHGTYIAPRAFHLDAYVDEQVFRFNNRELPDGARLEAAFEGIDGRRVTYAQLTDKEAR